MRLFKVPLVLGSLLLVLVCLVSVPAEAGTTLVRTPALLSRLLPSGSKKHNQSTTTTTTTTELVQHQRSPPPGHSSALVQRGGGGGGSFTIDRGLVQALAGTVVLAAIEQATKAGLKAINVQYPAQLGACILLFVTLCVLDLVAPAAASSVFAFLSPGAALLAKWFPIFFVPGLAMLPLSPSMGGTIDVRYSSVLACVCMRLHMTPYVRCIPR
jgi:uncharacterized membrane protein YeaQ/YmgE (transglycosylase-associated protein family)